MTPWEGRHGLAEAPTNAIRCVVSRMARMAASLWPSMLIASGALQAPASGYRSWPGAWSGFYCAAAPQVHAKWLSGNNRVGSRAPSNLSRLAGEVEGAQRTRVRVIGSPRSTCYAAARSPSPSVLRTIDLSAGIELRQPGSRPWTRLGASTTGATCWTVGSSAIRTGLRGLPEPASGWRVRARSGRCANRVAHDTKVTVGRR